MSFPIVVTIAGSDSSGGAGIQADLKTFSALGVYGASVITALTAQNTTGVSAIHIPPADFIYEQMKAVFTDLDVKAVKIGMLGNAKIIETVTHALKEFYSGPVILDPVMVATSGDQLLSDNAEYILKSLLLPRADLITPNLHEAAHLLNGSLAKDEGEMRSQLQELVKLNSQAVLLKGGHLESSNDALDLLFDGANYHSFSKTRIKTQNTHGTGCTLSSAIAANIAKGESLIKAVEEAKNYVNEAIKHASDLDIGTGAGPLHHTYKIS